MNGKQQKNVVKAEEKTTEWSSQCKIHLFCELLVIMHYIQFNTKFNEKNPFIVYRHMCSLFSVHVVFPLNRPFAFLFRTTKIQEKLLPHEYSSFILLELKCCVTHSFFQIKLIKDHYLLQKKIHLFDKDIQIVFQVSEKKTQT